MRLLIAGGGTGGHVFPGIAVAEEWVGRKAGEVLFVGTSRGMETRAVPAAGYALETLDVSGLKRVGLLGAVRGLFRLPLALVRSITILRRFRPDVVLGEGGYASGPLLLAAFVLGLPTAIQEVNSVPGFTNRILGRIVRRVFIAFADTARFFPWRKVEELGTPVRRAIVAALESAAETEAASGVRLLVVGGSQGARAVSELVVEAAAKLADDGIDFSLLHQTGSADCQRMQERYRARGLAGRVTVQAFIDDMAAAYAQADLVIARAGALTLAELAMAGKPAILIPLPTAADDHQSKNAACLAAAGAAVVLDQRRTGAAALAGHIAGLGKDPDRRSAMGQAMRRLARPRAASDTVDRLQGLAAPR